MAEISHFRVANATQAQRISGRVALRIDNLARERNALAAFGLEPERTIGLAGADCAIARGGAHVTFPDSIANADDHSTLTSLQTLWG
jgi:hypothetical protein